MCVYSPQESRYGTDPNVQRIFDAGTPTTEQQASQMWTSASETAYVNSSPIPLVIIMITPPIEPHLKCICIWP